LYLPSGSCRLDDDFIPCADPAQRAKLVPNQDSTFTSGGKGIYLYKYNP
jgi:hypothetical protein